MSGLLPGWSEELVRGAAARERALRHRLSIPRLDEGLVVGEVHCARNREEAGTLVEMFRALDLRAVAIDIVCEPQAELELSEGRVWTDIRAKRARFVALAAITRETRVVRAVLDLRSPAVEVAFEEILRLDTTWVGHDLKPVLHAIWARGIEHDPRVLYDTYIAAAAANLGRFHKRTAKPATNGEGERIEAEQSLAREKAEFLSLAGQCEEYGLPCPALQFLVLPDAITTRIAPDLVAAATSTACLYLRQRAEPLFLGLDHHLHAVEFPYVVANARVEWHGVHVGEVERRDAHTAVNQAAGHWANVLGSYGFDSSLSPARFRRFLSETGLWTQFLRDGHVSLEDDLLLANESLHPAIEAYRLYRRYDRIAKEAWFSGAMTGKDGRVHPVHQQLGAATGRNTCTTPNIVGIGRVMRPVVTAPPGRALVELDYGQIEVGVVAALHRDAELVRAFNTGDVYVAMAQKFYEGELSPAERAMSPSAFKARHPDLRSRMKVFVLAVLYGMQPEGIAKQFGVSVAVARREHGRFLELYPALARRLAESAAYGFARRCATIHTGLRRHVEGDGAKDLWTENFLRNTPVQGAAAVVFKRAVIRLDRAFQGTTTMLVLPIHDAVLIECDLEALDEVAATAVQIMGDVLREEFPELQPRVDVNKRAPWCWNKDGHHESLDRFVRDPSYRLDGLGPARAEPVVDRDPEIAPCDGWEFGPRDESEEELAIATAGSSLTGDRTPDGGHHA